MRKSYIVRNIAGAIAASLFYAFVCYWFSILYTVLSATNLYIEGSGETNLPPGTLVFIVTHLSCFLVGSLICKKDERGRRAGLIASGIFVLIAMAIVFLQISTVGGIITPYYICSATLAAAFITTGFGFFGKLREKFMIAREKKDE